MQTVWPSEIDGLAIRQQRRITVVAAEQYDPGFPPGRLLEFAAWLQAIINEIPEECRESAEIEIDSTSSYYDSHYAQVQVTYRRPETDKEWDDRKADVMRRVHEAEALERQALERLKAKYDPA